MTQPCDPVGAATHADPYPYYASLTAAQPFRFDPALKLWVAADAASVAAVLQEPACRVRPAAEPVPALLSGAAAGDVFRHLVRMTDGPAHYAMKRALMAVLSPLSDGYVSGLAWHCARQLLRGGETEIDRFIFALPVQAMAALLGVPERHWPQVVTLTGDFVRGIAPGAGTGQVVAGHAAAAGLLEMLGMLLSAGDPGRSDGLLWRLHEAAQREGCGNVEAVLANAVGLLMQAHDATAGLLGNALLRLREQPALRRQLAASRDLLPDFLMEVLRFDPPVQNTRRFAAADCDIAGRRIHASDAILLLLAAANRDPALNPQPDVFLLQRDNRRLFTFGLGSHGCAGDRIAVAVAVAGIAAMLDTATPIAVAYRPSINARIPLFGR